MARILIVDDEKEVIFLIKFILEKSGHTVSTASNGQEALAALGVDPDDPAAALPDIILLDVMMPIMDGYTASIKLRENERTRKIPILVVTAHGDMRHLFEAASNISGYLQKPFEPKKLKEQVEKILSGAS
jgi:CheY-like chemotaxis protein